MNELKAIENRRTIDEVKKITNTRILSINHNGFGVDNNKKINHMIKYCIEW